VGDRLASSLPRERSFHNTIHDCHHPTTHSNPVNKKSCLPKPHTLSPSPFAYHPHNTHHPPPTLITPLLPEISSSLREHIIRLLNLEGSPPPPGGWGRVAGKEIPWRRPGARTQRSASRAALCVRTRGSRRPPGFAAPICWAVRPESSKSPMKQGQNSFRFMLQIPNRSGIVRVVERGPVTRANQKQK